jgi:hypothetical protein
MHEQFKFNTGRNYRQHQHGLVAAVATARELAARYNETFTVYADWTGYGYCTKPAEKCLPKHDEIMAREIAHVLPNGQLRPINHWQPKQTPRQDTPVSREAQCYANYGW